MSGSSMPFEVKRRKSRGCAPCWQDETDSRYSPLTARYRGATGDGRLLQPVELEADLGSPPSMEPDSPSCVLCSPYLSAVVTVRAANDAPVNTKPISMDEAMRFIRWWSN